MPWADLKPEMIAGLGAEDFERFCCELVAYEANDRHCGHSFDGPTGAYRSDGGRDLLLTVKEPPRIDKSSYRTSMGVSPVTEDAGETAYSCKSGEHWWEDAKRDAKDPNKLVRAVEVLADGGHFKLVTSRVAPPPDAEREVDGQTASIRDHLVRLMQERVDALGEQVSVAERVEILTGNDIWRYCRARRPESLLESWATTFGIEAFPGVLSLDGWARFHTADRGTPAFEWDNERGAMRQSLIDLFATGSGNAADRAAWLIGAPGIGKTRLVLESLREDPGLQQRTLVAATFQKGLDAMYAGLFSKHPTALLVVDDCGTDQAGQISAEFAACSGPGSHLLVLTPSSSTKYGSTEIRRRWIVSPLADESLDKVISRELEGKLDSGERAEIARLSEGYPWFAKLLCDEAREQKRGPKGMAEAVEWALASAHEASGSELTAVREERARALLAVSLTHGVDWDDLKAELQDEISAAVGLASWELLRRRAHECERRGLIRLRYKWVFKYVTPLVLEREIIKRLLGRNDSDPGGSRLSQKSKFCRDRLGPLLMNLGLDDLTLRSLLAPMLEDLETSDPSWATFMRAVRDSESRLMLAARHLPERVARELARRVDATSIATLRQERSSRRAVVWALESLVSRKQGFEYAEEALFRLAQAENETYGNNATAVWRDVFHIELNTTHRSARARLELLGRRLRHDDPGARLVALGGLETMIGRQGGRIVPHPLDEGWTQAGARESYDVRSAAWGLLAERIRDDDESVSRAAKQLAIRNIRFAVAVGLSRAVEVLVETVGEFDGGERIKLRSELAMCRAYDAEHDPDLLARIAPLEQALVAASYEERLRSAVGSWGPAATRDENKETDRSLAAEGLDRRNELVAQLPWLLSGEAARSVDFMTALGASDAALALEPQIRKLAVEPHAAKLYALYLEGRKQAGGQISTVLESLEGDAEATLQLAYSLGANGANEGQAEWLRHAIEEERLGADAVYDLGKRLWLVAPTRGASLRLLDTLLGMPDVRYALVGLELLDREVERDPGASDFAETARRVLSRVATQQSDTMTSFYWDRVAEWLAEQGDLAFVAAASAEAIAAEHPTGDMGWGPLHACARADSKATWRAMARVLSGPTPETGRLLAAFRFHRVGFDWPVDDVLAWVGQDERRGRYVAELVRPYAEVLPGILRELIIRFGADSSVARSIASRMRSTDGVVSSLAQSDKSQLARVRAWAEDEDPTVAEFAQKLAESLERQADYHGALEEEERRRLGRTQ